MTKKILWTVLVSSCSAVAAAIAARAAHAIWCQVANEPPPDVPRWAQWIVGKPVRAGASRAIDAAAS